MIDAAEIPKLNIKDLIIENPAKKDQPLFFDPNKEVSDEKWQDILQEISFGREVKDVVEIVAPLVMLFPEQKDELLADENFINSIRDDMLNSIKENQAQPDRNEFLDPGTRQLAAFLQVICPESNIAEELGWEKSSAVLSIENALSQKPSRLYQRIVFDSLLLFPGIADELKSLPGLREILENDARTIMEDKLDTDKAYNAATLKLLYNDADPEFLTVKMEDLKHLYRNNERSDSWKSLLTLMLPLTILSAEDSRVIPHGIAINMRKKDSGFENSHPEMPEARKF